MKSIKYIIFLFVLVYSEFSYSQISTSGFTGVTWKVNEFYLNYVKYTNGTIDSLRYHFTQNGILELRDEETVTLNYTFNPVDSVITVTDSNAVQNLLKVMYSDPNNFVFSSSNSDPETGELLISEFRMVPE